MVWGRVEETETQDQEDIEPGQECVICRAARVEIYLKHCMHKVCRSCMNKLRKEAVYKVFLTPLHLSSQME